MALQEPGQSGVLSSEAPVRGSVGSPSWREGPQLKGVAVFGEGRVDMAGAQLFLSLSFCAAGCRWGGVAAHGVRGGRGRPDGLWPAELPAPPPPPQTARGGTWLNFSGPETQLDLPAMGRPPGWDLSRYVEAPVPHTQNRQFPCQGGE